jgi:membrane associated rhomboid family serine protease
MLPIRDVNPTATRPVVTGAIIAINVLVFLAIQPQESPAADDFAYRNAAIACEITTGAPLELREIETGECTDRAGTPFFPDKSLPGSIVVSMFLHGGLAHLGFNMWSLWIFGNNVEEAYGRLGYALVYLLSGIAATFGFVIANPELTIPLVGASGAIAGMMGAYLVMFPRHQVMTLIFFRIVAIPSVVFLGIWLLSQFFLGDSSVAWEAHVAGFVFGAVITLPFRNRLLANTLEGRQAEALRYA